MTKEERTRTEMRDGVEYVCSPVRHGGKDVGFAPRRSFETDEEMLEHFGLPILCSLADRQFDQDRKNKVRAKFTRNSFNASAFGKAISDGTIDGDGLEECERIAEQKTLTLIKAAEIFLGFGKDAEVEPEKIHWDIL